MTPPKKILNTRVAVALAALAATGTLALPIWRVGIGWPLVAIAGFVVVLATRSKLHEGDTTDGERGWRSAAGIAAVVLVSVAGIRAAEWLVALCLAAATALVSYSLTGGRTWRGLARGLTAFPGVGLWALMRRQPPGRDWSSQRLWRVGAGIGCGLVLLFVFGALFRSADPAFARLLDGWSGSVPRAALGCVIAAALGLSAVQLTASPAGTNRAAKDLRVRFGLPEWVIPLVMLNALFALFVGTQATVLFAGHEYVLGRSGPDYAEYARDGFRQLTVVTVLALGVVIALSLLARRESSRERALLRGLGGVLCALTLVVVASALTRLSLYVSAYGFNAPRLLSFATEVWLGLIFVVVMAAGIRLRAPWLPKTVAALGTCVLLTVALVNPEAVMARTHIDRLDSGYPLDVSFLRSLSTDAADEINAMPEPERSCLLQAMAEELEQPDPWYGYNLSRQQARTLIQDRNKPNCDYLVSAT